MGIGDYVYYKCPDACQTNVKRDSLFGISFGNLQTVSDFVPKIGIAKMLSVCRFDFANQKSEFIVLIKYDCQIHVLYICLMILKTL